MNRVIGTKTTGAVIYDDSEAYEVDSTTTADKTYIRFENTTASQLLKCIDETGSTIITTYKIGLWSDRATIFA